MELQSFKESELFYFPTIAYDLRGEKQDSEAAKSGRMNQTYTMLVPSASKKLHSEPGLRKRAEASYFQRPHFYIKSVTLPR